MMPIEHAAHQALDWLQHELHPARYHQTGGDTSGDQENPMSLATFEQTIKDDVTIGITKAEDLAAHLKTIAEQHLPELAALQASPVVKALEGFVLPPEAEAFIADMVATMAAKYGTPAAPPAAPEQPAA